ncbi:sugar phosphate isomerase/epimerase [Bacillus sp. FSL W7-1360]
MSISLCTITFRHHLQSIENIAAWAAKNDFEGIELWGAHARNLACHEKYDALWIQSYGLSVSMISDYLSFHVSTEAVCDHVAELSDLAKRWQTDKIRVFAGDVASQAATSSTYEQVVNTLRLACEQLQAHGQMLVIETHPHTLADTPASLLRLIQEVDYPNLKVNFDVLHIWESGADPATVYKSLQSYIVYMHLKNVRARADLAVFAPAQVFSASGVREGMTSLFGGCINYERFFKEIAPINKELPMALEWFGEAPFSVLQQDKNDLARCLYHT